MRSLLAYLLAAVTAAVALWFGFPELWQAGNDDAEAAQRQVVAPPVMLFEVQPEPFLDRMDALGTVLANESVQITATASDQVAALHFEDGQQVEAGALLVELRADEERAQLEEAHALLADRQATYRRAEELVESKISSESDLDTARAQLLAAKSRVTRLQAAVTDREVRAPFAGTLGLRRISVGAYLRPESLITTLDDLSVVKCDFTIPETWLDEVGLGDRIVARSDAYDDRRFEGEISAIDTRLDVITRSVTMRAVLPNQEGLLRPGMLLKLSIERGDAPVLQVPESALLQEGQSHYVYLVGDDAVARRTKIEIGRRRVGSVEVRGGLAESDRVVVKGLERVQDGAAVQPIEKARS